MEKKILFLKARIGIEDPFPPLAFSYLGKIAQDKGFKVIIENLNAQYNSKTDEDIAELIKRENPAIVGINILTNFARDSYKLISKIKPDSKMIIAGGPHCTICPEEVLEKGADIVFIGEAENSFERFLDAFIANKSIKNIKGIAYKEKNKMIKNKLPEPLDLNTLPIPDRDIHKKEDYVKVKEEINNFGAVLTSRGCTGQCSFCFHSLFGKCFRFRSSDLVIKEIEELNKKYGVNFIDFVDDAFTANRKRLMEICDLIIAKKIHIKWCCASRVEFLNKEVLMKMKEAGCEMVSLGMESNIPETLIKTKKTSNPQWYIQQTENVLIWCKETGIRAGINTLTGFPWEKAEDIKKMHIFIKKIKKYVTQGFDGGIIQPQPGTEIYNQYAKEYRFEKWWLDKKPLFKDNYRPFFIIYYHRFWDHLHNNFFSFDKDVFREIDKMYKFMGKWNLYIITKRRFRNPIKVYVIYQALFILSNFSLFLYKISPKLERMIMERIKKFSYRFKFRKGTDNSNL
ncbi:MAG: B12-binding domain-containing radical SAM protein [Nanoarchaeota archaeon]